MVMGILITFEVLSRWTFELLLFADFHASWWLALQLSIAVPRANDTVYVLAQVQDLHVALNWFYCYRFLRYLLNNCFVLRKFPVFV